MYEKSSIPLLKIKPDDFPVIPAPKLWKKIKEKFGKDSTEAKFSAY